MKEEDLEYSTYPYHRYGGQQVGTSCGVLIVHRPTGMAAVSVNERSQMSNKVKAKALLEKLVLVLSPVTYVET